MAQYFDSDVRIKRLTFKNLSCAKQNPTEPTFEDDVVESCWLDSTEE